MTASAAKTHDQWPALPLEAWPIESWPLDAWHEAGMAMFVTQPDDELCAQASRRGVLLVAEVSASQDKLRDELRRLREELNRQGLLEHNPEAKH